MFERSPDAGAGSSTADALRAHLPPTHLFPAHAASAFAPSALSNALSVAASGVRSSRGLAAREASSTNPVYLYSNSYL